MSRRLKIFCVIAIAGLILHAVSLLDTHPEQDACTFGPVSNARYRELLAQAESYQWHNWPFIVWSEGTLKRLLTTQFARMTTEDSTPYEKIATMHAILRGIGADFLYMSPTNDPFGQAFERRGAVGFGYQIKVNRLALLYPGGSTGWLIAELLGPNGSSPEVDFNRKSAPGDVYFVVHYPNPFDPIPDVLHRESRSCPAVPNAALEPFFRPNAK